MLSKRYAQVNVKRCVSCGTCVKVCPKEAIEIKRGRHALVDAGSCVGCGRCERVCPACCIDIKVREATA